MKQTAGDYEAATFIVRLWREPHALTEHDPDWRGTALHVQSGTERGIHGIESLVQFVQNWLEASPREPEA